MENKCVKEEKEGVLDLPVYAYSGKIEVIDRPENVGAAVDNLKKTTLVGFDTETKPSFKKGEYHDVGLLQLATEDKVYLFRLHKCGFPESLRNILSDQKIKKVGVGIRDDIKELNKLGKFAAASFVDLQDIVSGYGIEDKSFSKLMTAIFRVKISKRQQTSNWENPILTEAQIRYAATDAWGALWMYKELTCHWEKKEA